MKFWCSLFLIRLFCWHWGIMESFAKYRILKPNSANSLCSSLQWAPHSPLLQWKLAFFRENLLWLSSHWNFVLLCVHVITQSSIWIGGTDIYGKTSYSISNFSDWDNECSSIAIWQVRSDDWIYYKYYPTKKMLISKNLYFRMIWQL